MMNWLIARIRYPYVMMHMTGDSNTNTFACGKEALYLRARPASYAVPRSADAAHLNGTPMEFCSPLVCVSCGGRIQLRSMDVQERGWPP